MSVILAIGDLYPQCLIHVPPSPIHAHSNLSEIHGTTPIATSYLRNFERNARNTKIFLIQTQMLFFII